MWRLEGWTSPEPCCRDPERQHQSLRLALGVEKVVLDSVWEAR